MSSVGSSSMVDYLSAIKRAFVDSDFDKDGYLNKEELQSLGQILFGHDHEGELYYDICLITNADCAVGLSWDDIHKTYAAAVNVNITMADDKEKKKKKRKHKSKSRKKRGKKHSKHKSKKDKSKHKRHNKHRNKKKASSSHHSSDKSDDKKIEESDEKESNDKQMPPGLRDDSSSEKKEAKANGKIKENEIDEKMAVEVDDDDDDDDDDDLEMIHPPLPLEVVEKEAEAGAEAEAEAVAEAASADGNDSAVSDLERLAEERKKSNEELEMKLMEMTDRMREMEQSKNNISDRYGDIQRHLQTVEREKVDLESQIAQLENEQRAFEEGKQEEFETLQRTIESISSKVASLESQLQNTEQLNREEIDRLQTQLESAPTDDAIESFRNENEKLDTKIHRLETQLSEMVTERDRQLQTNSALSNQQKNNLYLIESLRKQLSQSDESHQLLKQSKFENSDLREQLNDLSNDNLNAQRKYEMKIDKLSDNYEKKLESGQLQLTKEKNEHSRVVKELTESYRTQLNESQRRIQLLTADLEEMAAIQTRTHPRAHPHTNAHTNMPASTAMNTAASSSSAVSSSSSSAIRRNNNNTAAMENEERGHIARQASRQLVASLIATTASKQDNAAEMGTDMVAQDAIPMETEHDLEDYVSDDSATENLNIGSPNIEIEMDDATDRQHFLMLKAGMRQGDSESESESDHISGGYGGTNFRWKS